MDKAASLCCYYSPGSYILFPKYGWTTPGFLKWMHVVFAEILQKKLISVIPQYGHIEYSFHLSVSPLHNHLQKCSLHLPQTHHRRCGDFTKKIHKILWDLCPFAGFPILPCSSISPHHYRKRQISILQDMEKELIKLYTYFCYDLQSYMFLIVVIMPLFHCFWYILCSYTQNLKKNATCFFCQGRKTRQRVKRI